MRYFPYHSADFKLRQNDQIMRLWNSMMLVAYISVL